MEYEKENLESLSKLEQTYIQCVKDNAAGNNGETILSDTDIAAYEIMRKGYNKEALYKAGISNSKDYNNSLFKAFFGKFENIEASGLEEALH